MYIHVANKECKKFSLHKRRNIYNKLKYNKISIVHFFFQALFELRRNIAAIYWSKWNINLKKYHISFARFLEFLDAIWTHTLDE